MRNKIVLISVFILSLILRFWQLGVNPPSLDWDEAALGYNAYSILKTGSDEYGNFLPVSFRSFGDYKPPLYIYLSTLPVAIFGLNEFSTRFASAFLGTLTVFVAYKLFRELFPGKSDILYFIFYFIFSASPWHIQFSRVAFEANTAVFFLVLAIWMFVKGLLKGGYFLLSFVFFALSAYSYHSPRLVIPALLLGLFVIFKRDLRRKLLWVVTGSLLCLLLVYPILIELKTSTAARFGSVSILNAQEQLGDSIEAVSQDKIRGDLIGSLMHNRRIIFVKNILGGYLDHFNFDFLFLTGDSPGRHHSYGMGMLYIWELPFILIGLYYLLNNRSKNTHLLFWWFLVAPLASAFTKATPHAVRSLFYLPIYQMFAAFGLYVASNRIRNDSPLMRKYILVWVILLMFLLNFTYYIHMYYIHTPKVYADWWQYGYKETVEYAKSIENNYSKIIFTYGYDQPYIFYLFYNKIDPVWYQENWGGGEIIRDIRSVGKYEFRNIRWDSDSRLSNVLIIGTPKEIPSDANGIVKDINFPDGKVAFRIVAR